MKKFLASRNGNFSAIFAVVIVPVILAAGLAVDFARVVGAKSAAQEAADAAAFAIAPLIALKADALKEEGERFFFDNFKHPDLLEAYEFDAKRDIDNSVNITFVGRIDTVFMNVGNFMKMDFSVVSAVSGDANEFTDFYLMLDRSASTLIADGDQAIADLKALTKPMIIGSNREYWDPEGCAFACHDSEPWIKPAGTSLLQLAKDNGIPIRAQRVQKAASDLVNTVIGENLGARAAVFDFAKNSVFSQTPTADLTKIMPRIQDDQITGLDPGNTRYPEAFKALENVIGAQGVGSETNPKKMVVLITDGLYTHWTESGDHYDAFSAKFCDVLRQRAISIAVVNIIYDEIPGSTTYLELVAKPKNPETAKAELRKCADAGYYFEANDPGEIEATFKLLAEKLTKKPPRLLY